MLDILVLGWVFGMFWDVGVMGEKKKKFKRLHNVIVSYIAKNL